MFISSSWDAVKKAPRLEDLWQLNYSKEGGAEHNVSESFIANLIRVSCFPS